MTAVPHDAHTSDRDTSDPHTSPPHAPWRTRLALTLREFWHAMRAAHHERVP